MLKKQSNFQEKHTQKLESIKSSQDQFEENWRGKYMRSPQAFRSLPRKYKKWAEREDKKKMRKLNKIVKPIRILEIKKHSQRCEERFQELQRKRKDKLDKIMLKR